ncbi:ABC transporter ATP-binding protein [Pseudoalteromonas shioyasakiensis]|jgi:iron(III) transport system ATP-binding protein|uniref:ABC transporter ATP-binding protein n=1 Tax=Pseudoalteromonas shioyasakiensis TaxID=1190813 RepID=A0ABT6U244_9GAMM|nr:MULTISPECIES: ABC transporter ATP-binding protein [Pseudoalteromonas]MDI4670243.1 ABC transporter ATP-binding protein [Pseudoalteromonas shioyasakiensis]MDI4674854.1 ABC transporter ATP-binding protein [Pseudoalteromonas shioyasakiensis]MDI4687109.1 ABC transporter ATP-binding protein [Pseudoalteromonas shioyasakiensis]MDI4705704.1 ABC transporter ATP-binding protein [Pseudoalteromonas shioyasakiensis]NUJ22084.1 ABC transporter ATP-binding protein [Pseudoalteromonas sp. 0802]
MSHLIIKDLAYQYNATQVLSELNLNVEQDEIVCLLGASGCGKTTTLKAIAGILQPEQGYMSIDSKVVNDSGLFVAPEKRNIGMMFQDYALFPHLTVSDNIAFGLSNMSKAQKRERVDEMLSLVKLDGCAKRYPHQLSGGQQQRVAIARALAYKPSLLLLDEPFSNIDTQVRFELIADIRRIIKAQQVSAVFVTHSKEEAFAFADTLAVMHGGKIAQQGSPEQLFSQPNSKVVAEFLGTGIYLTAKVLTPTEYETAFGVVHSLTASNTNCQQGQVYIRPHHIQLCEAAHSDANSLTILHRRFIGTRYVYRINIAGQECEVAAEQDRVLAVEQPVKIKIMPHTVNFFHD